MEQSHADDEERQSQAPCSQDIPEIIWQGVFSLDEISGQYSSKYNNDTVDSQNAPIGQGILRKIP
jgi:hypothetical protein